MLSEFKKPLKVLDKGYLMLVDTMGDDTAITAAARVSYIKQRKGEDRELIRYLMRHQHLSPFEMCEIKLEIKAPIDVMRQWVRHRTASMNEVSTRYSEVPTEFYSPELWRKQSSNNKQGSAGFMEEDVQDFVTSSNALAAETYKCLLEKEVAREMARSVLPLSTYTRVIWKTDLRNLLHFLKLRTAANAQYEIKEYAKVIERIVKAWVPLTYEAYVDFEKESVEFSRLEVEALKRMLKPNILDLQGVSTGENAEWYAKITGLINNV